MEIKYDVIYTLIPFLIFFLYLYIRYFVDVRVQYKTKMKGKYHILYKRFFIFFWRKILITENFEEIKPYFKPKQNG